MKFRKTALLLITLFMSISAFCAFQLWRGKMMTEAEAKNKWGNVAFNAQKFKDGDYKTKAQMAYSLLRQEASWVGKDLDEVKRELGDPDGFYFVDIHPAYIIQKAKSKKDETWQIVFLLDNRFKVQKIFIHKSCCDS